MNNPIKSNSLKQFFFLNLNPLVTIYNCNYIYKILTVGNCEVLLKVLMSEQIQILSKSNPYFLNTSSFNTVLNVDRLYELIIMELQESKSKSKTHKAMRRLILLTL